MKRKIRISTIFALLLTLLLSSFVALPAKAASGAITAEFVVGYNSTAYYSKKTPSAIDLELPSGTTVQVAVNYACLNIDCIDGTLVVSFPASTSITSVSYSNLDVSSVDTAASVKTFHLKTLAAGYSGQLTFNVSMPGLTVLDNTQINSTVSTSTENGTTNSALRDTFLYNLRSSAKFALNVTKIAGGGLNSITKYGVSYCNSTVANTDGGILIESNSQIVVNVPATASQVDPGSGVYDSAAHTITWNISGQVAPDYCGSLRFSVFYMAPENHEGQSFNIPGSWTGRLVTELANHSLATGSVSHEVAQPFGQGKGAKTGGGPRPALIQPTHDASAGIGDTATWGYLLANEGIVDFDEVTITDEMADGYKTTSMIVNNQKDTGELWIQTMFGQDGLQGSPDDDDLFKVADLVKGNNDIDFYNDTTTNLPLDPIDRVTKLVAHVGGYALSTSTQVFAIRGKVDPTYRDGTEIVPNVDVIRNRITAVVTNHLVGNVPIDPATAIIDVDVPQLAGVTIAGWRAMSWAEPWTGFNDWWPYLSNGIWGDIDRNVDGVIQDAERYQWLETGVIARDLDLADPAVTLILPKYTSFAEYVSCSTGRCTGITNADLLTDYPGGYDMMPVVSVAKIDDFDGKGSTMVRFKLSPGSVLLKDNAWSIWVKVKLNPGSFGNMRFPTYSAASVGDMSCRDFSIPEVDKYDFDGDGMTNDVVCRADGVIPMPIISSGSVKAEVKGSWDLGYSTAGYTTPASADQLRATFQNTGTTGLTNTRVATIFARPSDDGIVTGAARNQSSSTFPVVLTGIPTVEDADGTMSGVTIYWSTELNPCLPEVGNYNPAGCASANWQAWGTVAPTDPKTVLSILVDFGSNISEPGDAWYVVYPVTTPDSGVNEPDFAIYAASNDPVTWEKALNSFGFITTPFNLDTNAVGLPLSKSESQTVSLAMPAYYGPELPPVPEPYESVAYKGRTQRVTLAYPAGGRITLLDSKGNEVTSLTVPGVGTYALNTSTGEVTFTPRPTYVGWPPAIDYRVYNYYNLSGDSTYRPKVIVGTAVAPPYSTSAENESVQNANNTLPDGATIKLIDPSGNEVESVTIAGKGTFVVNPVTKKIEFTPIPGYVGTASIGYRLIATDGSTADNYYYATVKRLPTPTPTPSPTATSKMADTGARVIGANATPIVLLLLIVGSLMLLGNRRRNSR